MVRLVLDQATFLDGLRQARKAIASVMPFKPKAHNAAQQQERKRAYERDRGTSRERGYDWQWEQYSAARLQQPEFMFCVRCKADGRLTCNDNGKVVTDHIKPARACTREEFMDPDNHQTLCIAHNKAKELDDLKRFPRS